MDSYGYPYPPPFPPMQPPDGDYPDHGDGFGEYYGMGPMGLLNEELEARPSRSKHRSRKKRESKRSRTRSGSRSRTRSRTRSVSRSQSRSKSRSRTKSRSRSRSLSRSRSGSRHRDLINREPGFLDAFRVLYLTPSKHKKNTPKFLATQKRQDRVQEILKRDGLGSKKWLFYPRSEARSETGTAAVPGSRDNCDQRIKLDGDFFRKYKRSKRVDSDAPIAKLRRWELMLYKKLGFIHAV